MPSVARMLSVTVAALAAVLLTGCSAGGQDAQAALIGHDCVPEDYERSDRLDADCFQLTIGYRFLPESPSC